MKYLIAFLLMACASAHAQVTAPPCYPLINGVHTAAPRHVIGEQGQHVFWACSPRGGQSRIYGFSCLHGQCSMSALHAAHAAIMSATAKVTAANTAWSEHVQFQCADVIGESSPRGLLCRERAALLKSLEIPR